jgi:hypothetical protein
MAKNQRDLKTVNRQKENTEGAESMACRLTKTKFIICMSLIMSHLTGCGSYSNKFDCPYGEGLGCASVSKVNKMLDANMVDTEDKLVSGASSQSQQQIPIYYGPMRPGQTMTFKGIPVI